MNYNKPMIDLVRELRKHVPSDSKPGIKLANPDLLIELVHIYHASSNNVLKALTRELFTMAGEDWLEKLQNDEVGETSYVTKIYRGQTRLVEKVSPPQNDVPKKSKRIYRGQVVA